MKEQITDDSDKEKLLNEGEFPSNPIVLTEIDSKFKNTSITKIIDINFDKDSVALDDIRLQFQVVGYAPWEINEIVTAYCPKCKTNSSVKPPSAKK